MAMARHLARSRETGLASYVYIVCRGQTEAGAGERAVGRGLGEVRKGAYQTTAGYIYRSSDCIDLLTYQFSDIPTSQPVGEIG